MRSPKIDGGFTRKTSNLAAVDACVYQNKSNHIMLELTGVDFNSREQKREMSMARQIGDIKGTVTIPRAQVADNFFPLHTDDNVRNIRNCVNADSNINADTAYSVGKKTLSSRSGMLATDRSSKRSTHAVSMTSKSSVEMANDQVQFDPQRLFQPLIFACENPKLIEELFQYELCTHPTAFLIPY